MSLQIASKETTTIVLSGDLDARTAPLFQAELERAKSQKPKSLVLHFERLHYLSSAGARVLLFEKQQMGQEVDIFIISPQEQVKETLRLTGVLNNVIVLEEAITVS